MYEKLYLLQDKIFKILSELQIDFYLTGGTALSRVYLNHRYSDDLDFFINDSDKFKKQIDIIINKFEQKKVKFNVKLKAERFCSIFIDENDTILKLDFVNDIPFKIGKLISLDLYPRIDNPLNILSNKISALGRFESKDIVDILFIARSYEFNWKEIIESTKKKDSWVNPIEISKIIFEFPISKFEEIKWIKNESFKEMDSDLNIISKDILLAANNSLFKKS
ncbi:MAG: nucleotidyl transferase AbiEii/AbiGii toxin family protein [Candidatus Marinimicrobia bacterium]|nr:nucleotidyl transferase AbiEii/AbiGii toxin family protein [Candidatus Neomarinimicrobiota bacterium]